MWHQPSSLPQVAPYVQRVSGHRVLPPPLPLSPPPPASPRPGVLGRGAGCVGGGDAQLLPRLGGRMGWAKPSGDDPSCTWDLQFCTTGTCRICIGATRGRGQASVRGDPGADGGSSGAADAPSEGLGSLRAPQPLQRLDNIRQKTLIQTRVLHS